MNRTKPLISNALEPLTAKQIAQTYVINDIIMHELILEAINEVESSINDSGNVYSKSDIVNRICVLVGKDKLSKDFDISRADVLWTLKAEYIDEILALATYNCGQKK